jgi:hypothetical protein
MKKKNEIRAILAKLEDAINKRMDVFMELGKEAKAVTILGDPEMKLDKIYIEMAKIADELRPVLPTIKNQHPNLEALLDALITLHDKNIKDKDV